MLFSRSEPTISRRMRGRHDLFPAAQGNHACQPRDRQGWSSNGLADLHPSSRRPTPFSFFPSQTLVQANIVPALPTCSNHALSATRLIERLAACACLHGHRRGRDQARRPWKAHRIQTAIAQEQATACDLVPTAGGLSTICSATTKCWRRFDVRCAILRSLAQPRRILRLRRICKARRGSPP